MEYLALSLILAALAVAGYTDFRYSRIPNWLTVPAAMAGLGFWYIAAGLAGLKMSAIGFGVGLFVFLIPFVFGGMGGGDVKLMAAVGALVGWPLIVWAVLLSCVTALFFTVARAIWEGSFLKLMKNTWKLTAHTFLGIVLRRPVDEVAEVARVQATVHVPFGIAIALGTAWALVLQFLIDRGTIGSVPFIDWTR